MNQTQAQETLKQTSESAKENIQDFRDRANRFAGRASERAKIYYGNASDWMQDNYGKTLAVAGALVAAGLIGYFIGRGNKENITDELEQL